MFSLLQTQTVHFLFCTSAVADILSSLTSILRWNIVNSLWPCIFSVLLQCWLFLYICVEFFAVYFLIIYQFQNIESNGKWFWSWKHRCKTLMIMIDTAPLCEFNFFDFEVDFLYLDFPDCCTIDLINSLSIRNMAFQ